MVIARDVFYVLLNTYNMDRYDKLQDALLGH